MEVDALSVGPDAVPASLIDHDREPVTVFDKDPVFVVSLLGVEESVEESAAAFCFRFLVQLLEGFSEAEGESRGDRVWLLEVEAER